MRVLSLFSGVGGLDLGLERAGHEVVGQVELDDFRHSVLRRHWPRVPTARDVRVVSSGTFERPDLLCGGFPCRDLSVVGQRRGLEAAESGDGSGLFFELCRVADDLLGPGGWLLIENVPGMLHSAGGRDFAVLLRTLGDLGFHDLAWRVLDSRGFGVPQLRRRVFVLARRAAGGEARRVLLDAEGGEGDPRPGAEEGTGAASSDPEGSGDHGEAGRLIAEGKITRALTARLGTSGWDLTDAEGNLLVAAVAENQRGEVLEVPDARTLVVGGGKPGQGYPLVRIGETLRRLTPTECERLQGFPDGWTLPGGPSLAETPSWYQLPREEVMTEPPNPRPHAARWEAMGRAVTVPVAEYLGRLLCEA